MSFKLAPADMELPDPYDEGGSGSDFNRCFKDPVWDLIEFEPIVCQIVDTCVLYSSRSSSHITTWTELKLSFARTQPSISTTTLSQAAGNIV
ncbi:hypothetical protein FRC01_009026, partial [Tulasnella sp. 417]